MTAIILFWFGQAQLKLQLQLQLRLELRIALISSNTPQPPSTPNPHPADRKSSELCPSLYIILCCGYVEIPMEGRSVFWRGWVYYVVADGWLAERSEWQEEGMVNDLWYLMVVLVSSIC